MKRNIGYIELIVVLCLVVIAVKVWTYKKPENKPKEEILLPMATTIIKGEQQIQPLPTQKPTHNTYYSWEHPTYKLIKKNLQLAICEKCGYNKFVHYSREYKRGRMQIAECTKCGWKHIETLYILKEELTSINLPENTKTLTLDKWIELLDEEN